MLLLPLWFQLRLPLWLRLQLQFCNLDPLWLEFLLWSLLGLCSPLCSDFPRDLLSSFEEPNLGWWLDRCSAGGPIGTLILDDPLVDEDLVLGWWLDPEL